MSELRIFGPKGDPEATEAVMPVPPPSAMSVNEAHRMLVMPNTMPPPAVQIQGPTPPNATPSRMPSGSILKRRPLPDPSVPDEEEYDGGKSVDIELLLVAHEFIPFL